MEKYHSTTCTVRVEQFQSIPNLNNKANLNLDTYASDDSRIFVQLNFHNWQEYRYKLNCWCPGDCTALTAKYDDELSDFMTFLTFPLDPQTLHSKVYMAESTLGLPDYVTPGVWTDVKNYLSTVFDVFGVDCVRCSGYIMVVGIDVSTIYHCGSGHSILGYYNRYNVPGLANDDDDVVVDDGEEEEEVFYDPLDEFEDSLI